MIVLLALLYLLAWMSAAQAVPAIAAVLTAVGVTGGITIGATTITYASIVATAIVTAASIGLSILLAPRADGSGKSQITVKEARPPRRRIVGRDKLAGAHAALEHNFRYVAKALVHCEGPVHAIEEIWLNDKPITLAGSSPNAVSTLPWGPFVIIETKTGTTTQAASSILMGTYDAYGDFSANWSSAHQLKGLCYTVIRCQSPTSPEQFSRRFPNGFPEVRIVATMAVFDPRDDSTGFSLNPSLWIRDYLTSSRGMAISPARIDDASFEAFADVCDEAIPLKAGGTEPRYQISGSYDLTEEPREVLRRHLQTCDAELYMTPEGKVAIRGGVWEEPTVTITEEHIRSYSYEQGNDKLAAFNRIILSYKSPDHDFQITETEEWDDEESQTLSGEVKTQDLTLSMVPSHGQARRLAKITMAKGNPRHKLTLQTNMYGLHALGERIIRVVLPEINVDDTFYVLKHEIIIAEPQGCLIELASIDASAYALDANAEEGTAPPIPKGLSSPVDYSSPPLPTGLALELQRTEISPGVFVLRILAEVDEPTGSWPTQFEYRIEGVGSWLIMPENPTDITAVSDILSDGATYEVRAAHVGTGGTPGLYTAAETIEAVSDETPPDAPTDLDVTPGTGFATLEWLNPNSGNYYATRLYRGTTATFGDATLIATRYGAANALDVYVDTVAAGTYYWWAVAINGSGVASTEAGPVTDTVT